MGAGLPIARVLRRIPLLPLAGAVALLACGSIAWLLAFGGDDDPNAASETVALAATPTASPTPLAEVERLIIPSIKLDVPVVARTVADSGEMPSPEGPNDVIWYDFSALPGLGGRPGGGGNTVFAGHMDFHDYGPAVFWDLRNVKDGDVITVQLRDGSEFHYTAKSNRVIDPAATPFNEIVSSTPEESLTVITCAGDYDPGTHNYDLRRIVWAVRAG